MRIALDTFNRNMDSIKTLHAIHEQFEKTYTALDLSEILRAEYVLVVSAFDCFLHDLVQNYMHVITFDTNDETLLPNAYKNFKIKLGVLQRMLAADVTNQKQILHAALKKSLSEFSFESPQTIEQALGYIGVRKIWTQIANKLNLSAEDVKRQLSMIVFRRNCIAHQADIANYTDEFKQPINREDVGWVIDFMEKISNCINDIVITQYSS